MTDHWSIETRKAAIPHRCGECRGIIERGQTYARWFQVSDGWAMSGHLCLTCQDMRNTAWVAFDWDLEEGPTLGELRNWLMVEEGVENVDAWYAGRVAEREAAAKLKSDIDHAASVLQCVA